MYLQVRALQETDEEAPKYISPKVLIKGATEATELLWDCCLDGAPNGVKLAIEAGADVNEQVPPDYYSPLHIAISVYWDLESSFEVCKLLLEAGADPSAVDAHGTTPIDLAKDNERQDVLEFMAQHQKRQAIRKLKKVRPKGAGTL